MLAEPAPQPRPSFEQAVCWMNGRLMPAAEATVSVFDHGLLYGDGVFEGIRFYHRRAFRLQPQSEPAVFYALVAMRNLTAILALEHHSLTTVLFPAVLGWVCLVILGLLLWRRAALAPAQAKEFR